MPLPPVLPAVLLCVAFVSAGPALGGQAAPDPQFSGTRTFTREAPLVTAEIAGQPVRLRVDFAAHAPIFLSAAAVERLKLAADARPGTRKKPLRGTIRSDVGRTRVRVPWSVEAVSIEGVVQTLAVAAPPGYAMAGADGAIRPSALPFAVVRLEQRAARAGDRETVLQVVEDGRFDGLPFRAAAGADAIQVELAPWRARSVGTAATGGALAVLQGGRLTGPVADTPIIWGVARPTRELRLDRPWPAGGVKLPAMLMRVRDWEGRHPVPLDGDVDAQTIQVSARRDAQRGVRLLQLGQDVLGACAAFEWRREGNLLAMHCPAP